MQRKKGKNPKESTISSQECCVLQQSNIFCNHMRRMHRGCSLPPPQLKQIKCIEFQTHLCNFTTMKQQYFGKTHAKRLASATAFFELMKQKQSYNGKQNAAEAGKLKGENDFPLEVSPLPIFSTPPKNTRTNKNAQGGDCHRCTLGGGALELKLVTFPCAKRCHIRMVWSALSRYYVRARHLHNDTIFSSALNIKGRAMAQFFNYATC